jgi:hypothetical protein
MSRAPSESSRWPRSCGRDTRSPPGARDRGSPWRHGLRWGHHHRALSQTPGAGPQTAQRARTAAGYGPIFPAVAGGVKVKVKVVRCPPCATGGPPASPGDRRVRGIKEGRDADDRSRSGAIMGAAARWPLLLGGCASLGPILADSSRLLLLRWCLRASRIEPFPGFRACQGSVPARPLTHAAGRMLVSRIRASQLRSSVHDCYAPGTITVARPAG